VPHQEVPDQKLYQQMTIAMLEGNRRAEAKAEAKSSAPSTVSSKSVQYRVACEAIQHQFGRMPTTQEASDCSEAVEWMNHLYQARNGKWYYGHKAHCKEVNKKWSVSDVQAYMADPDRGVFPPPFQPEDTVKYANIDDYWSQYRCITSTEAAFYVDSRSRSFWETLAVACHYAVPGQYLILKNGKPMPSWLQQAISDNNVRVGYHSSPASVGPNIAQHHLGRCFGSGVDQMQEVREM